MLENSGLSHCIHSAAGAASHNTTQHNPYPYPYPDPNPYPYPDPDPDPNLDPDPDPDPDTKPSSMPGRVAGGCGFVQRHRFVRPRHRFACQQ